MVAAVDKLVEHINKHLGANTDWPQWPGGWQNEIEAALLDAVFSAAARYGGQGSGVRGVVAKWRDHRGGPLDDLTQLAGALEHHGGAEQLAALLGNRQYVPGRGDRPRKAEAVCMSAQQLVAHGVRTSEELKNRIPRDQRLLQQAFTATRGVGYATWRYFLLLLGGPGVKPDRMVKRFVMTATGVESPQHAEQLVEDAAANLGVSPTELDHAIWQYQRRQPSR